MLEAYKVDNVYLINGKYMPCYSCKIELNGSKVTIETLQGEKIFAFQPVTDISKNIAGQKYATVAELVTALNDLLSPSNAVQDVVIEGKISANNSSFIPLGINGDFTGIWDDTLNYSEVIVSIYTNQPSITNGLIIQWSADGVNVHGDDVFTISASSGKTFSFPCQNKYVRVLYTNDGIAQTSFALQTLLKPFASKGSSHRLKDDLNQEDDAIVTKSQIVGFSTAGGTSLKNVKVNPSGALTVDSTISNDIALNGTPITGETLEAGGSNVLGWLSSIRKKIAALLTATTDGTQKTQIVDNSGNILTLFDRQQTPTEKVIGVQIGPGDIISNLPVIQLYDHHQIHEGETWRWSVYTASLGLNANKDVRFKVPYITIPLGSNPVILCPHFRFEIISSDLAYIQFYEAPTITVSGTQRTPLNLERNGLYTPKLQIFEDPTNTALGTLIWQGLLTATKSSGGGIEGSQNEFVLKNNTEYLYRVTSLASNNRIMERFVWYEDLGV